MDSKKKTSLDDLLNQVRQGKPVWDKEEAMNWLHEKESLPLTKSRSTLKPFIMTSIAVSIGVALAIWLAPHEERIQSSNERPNSATFSDKLNTENPKNDPNQSAFEMNAGESTPESNSYQAKRKTESELQASVSPIDTPKVDTIKVIRIITQETDEPGNYSVPTMDTEGSEFIETIEAVEVNQGASAPCLAFSGTLKLKPEELQKLGIIQSENSLLFQQDHTSEGKFQLVMKSVNEISQTSSRSGLASKKNDDLLPLAVLGCQRNWAFRRQELEDIALLKSAIAVEIPMPGGSVVFFYSAKEKFMNQLPESVQNELKAKPNRYCLTTEEAFQKPNIVQMMTDRGPKINIESKEDLFVLGTRLKNLGIAINDQGFELKRGKIEISYLESGMMINSRRSVSETELRTEKDISKLLPLYVTSASFHRDFPIQMGSILPSLNGQGQRIDHQSKFLFDKWSLIPIAVEHPEQGTFLFWYAYSPALKTLLSETENAKALERVSQVKSTFQYTGAQASFVNVQDLFVEELPEKDALNAIEPNANILKSLGIRVNEKGQIEVNQPYGESGMMTDIFSKGHTEILISKKSEESIDTATRASMKKAFDALVSITDDMGRNSRLHRWMEEGVDLNKLIPVRVRSGQTYTLDDKINQRWRPDIILWYMPTPDLLAMLEANQDTLLQGVTTSLDENENKESCRYTEVCRNKTGVFSEHKLFPNPAMGSSNFTWTSSEAVSYRINLYALNGQKVKSFEQLQAVKGKNNYQLSLSGLAPGVYMVILHSEKGDEIHERLVVNQ